MRPILTLMVHGGTRSSCVIILLASYIEDGASLRAYKMTEALCMDIAMFPGATDVVRVNSTRWEAHADVLERLADQIASFLREHSDPPIDDLLSELARRDPHIRVGDQLAHVLYGPRTLFLGADGELDADMRGVSCTNPRAIPNRSMISLEMRDAQGRRNAAHLLAHANRWQSHLACTDLSVDACCVHVRKPRDDSAHVLTSMA